MIKKLAFIVMLSPLSAYATYPAPTPTPNTNIRIENEAYLRSQAQALANSKSVANAGAVSGSISGANAQGGAASANGGSSSAGSDSNSGGNTISSTYNQVRQTPFAFAPSTNVGVGKYRCKDGVSLGASAGFGAIGGGMPVSDDVCEKLVKADWLAEHGMMEESCEMVLLDDDIADVFKKTGRKCKNTAAPVPVAVIQPVRASNVPSDAQWDRMEQLREAQFSAIMAKRKHK